MFDVEIYLIGDKLYDKFAKQAIKVIDANIEKVTKMYEEL